MQASTPGAVGAALDACPPLLARRGGCSARRLPPSCEKLVCCARRGPRLAGCRLPKRPPRRPHHHRLHNTSWTAYSQSVPRSRRLKGGLTQKRQRLDWVQVSLIYLFQFIFLRFYFYLVFWLGLSLPSVLRLKVFLKSRPRESRNVFFNLRHVPLFTSVRNRRQEYHASSMALCVSHHGHAPVLH